LLTFLSAASDQVPATAQAFAEEFEAQVALLQLGLRIALRRPYALVELIDVTLAVPFLYITFKIRVGERVVFDLYRQSLDLWIVAWPFGNGPTLQDVADLKPDVKMASTGMVQLNHENGAARLRAGIFRPGLAGLVEVPLAAVLP